jgi:hypothetical protein
MSTVDWHTTFHSTTLTHLLGRTFMIGLFLALWAALLPICTIYSFIWIARL